MIKLKKVLIKNYKSINSEQTFEVEDDITTIVGMNESGKTAILEAIAKTNYFDEDPTFKFNSTADFPRKDLKRFQRNTNIEEQEVVECTYKIEDSLISEIEGIFGKDIISNSQFKLVSSYNNDRRLSEFNVDFNKYIEHIIEEFEIKEIEKKLLKECKNFESILEIEDKSEELNDFIQYYTNTIDKPEYKNWSNKLIPFIYFKYVKPKVPKFWYYDEYYNLQSKIDLRKIVSTSEIQDPSMKTAKALLDVSGLDVNTILNNNDYEEYIAELEATSIDITDLMFKYWKANDQLDIEFNIANQNSQAILNIRVENRKHRVTIPLSQRSKGFNWFFSFIVWFTKIRQEKNSNYILLLDEPGLNLHASAQRDLLNFIDDLSDKYQVILTTHSPFMVESASLHKVRTAYEGIEGTQISDAEGEKDDNTLFPLQAALGYELSQNLYVAEKNLLVEGPADLLYLKSISEYLKSINRTGLDESIAIVPIGGLDKVPAFISLMRGNDLKIIALLDSFENKQGQQRLEDMVKRKIISNKNIKFYQDYIQTKDKADIEDLFTISEYLKFFNKAFPNSKIETSQIKNKKSKILPQINEIMKVQRFNHYKPAQEFVMNKITTRTLSESTLDRFEKIFISINSRFENEKK